MSSGSDSGERIRELNIEEEMKGSYLTYAMSVIVSRALPDVRDGLKPSQRRILVAMNDLNLSPGASTSKCAGIVGETMKRYHPHGDGAIYPTLVRMGQVWNSRYMLVHKQGNFGSIAGLPPAAMRYTEARLSAIAAEMLEDIQRDTVDFVPTYDERNVEPTVLPSKFPNLLVNGSTGIAVGMASSIPPHNLSEVCDAVVHLIDNPEATLDELMEIIPGPDFPTGGIICGRWGILNGYATGRSNIVLRGRVEFEKTKSGKDVIVVTEIPYQQSRDRVVEKIAHLGDDGRIKGISRVIDESDRNKPVRIVIELKRDANRDVVLNQLYQLSPLQDTFSLILLALVDGRPRTLPIKDMLLQFIRHRLTVIRRRTLFLLAQAEKRKHHVEGLLIALHHIDEIIRIIRSSDSVDEARNRLIDLVVSAQILERALGDDGFAAFKSDRGDLTHYTMTRRQADSILQMQLQRLTRLEQDKLVKEYGELHEEILGYRTLLSDEANILQIIRDDMVEIKGKFGDKRRTDISDEELGNFNREDLIREEPMTVTISHEGYIKRMSIDVSRSQGRGGRGVTAADTKEGDFQEHVFIASTHAYMLFFTDQGRVHWLKVYDVPLLGRTSRGRAIVNVLSLQDGEKIASVIPVRDFESRSSSLLMATRRGIVKKTELSAYSRPMKGGIIAIRLDEDDGLIGVIMADPKDEVILSTRKGVAIRFAESDARSMGRATRGVKGITLGSEDEVVGLVRADTESSLLSVCENGYGKRTPFGVSTRAPDGAPEEALSEPVVDPGDEPSAADSDDVIPEAGDKSNMRYRTQRRGGKGLIDIKTTERNGDVVATAAVKDGEDLVITTTRGMMVRIPVSEINTIGRNTQGVRLIRLQAGDTVASLAVIAPEHISSDDAESEAGSDIVEPDVPDVGQGGQDEPDANSAASDD